MRWPPRSNRHARTAAARHPIALTLLVALAAAVAPAASSAVVFSSASTTHTARRLASARVRAHQRARKPSSRLPTITPALGGGASTPAPTTTPTASSGTIDSGGSADFLNGLGLTSPFCGQAGLSASQQASCQISGSPWTDYPVGNYGLDINVGATGALHPLNTIAAFLQGLINALWMLGLYIFKGALTLVELTFGLNLFKNQGALRGVSGTLTNLYARFDVPWMSAVLAAIGLWGIWTGLVQRKVSYTIGATLASIAMIVIAVWVIARPADTTGALYEASNDAAITLIAAPTSGNLTDPQASFSTAITGLWNQLVRDPWCALDFASVSWCEGKPEPQAVAAAAKDAWRDNATLDSTLRQALSPSAGNCRSLDCVQHYLTSHSPYPPAATRADLYLRYSPNSPPRQDLWTYYHGTDDSHILVFDIGGGHAGAAPGRVAIQGADGWQSRIGLVLLLGIAMLGALLLFVWIAFRLLLQTAYGLLLLILTPVALVFPAFGENGRAMFAKWGKALIGAMVAKAFYAAMLAAAVTGSSVIGLINPAGASTGAWGLEFLLLAGFWWALFLKRNEILALVQVAPRNHLADPERGHPFLRTAGAYAAVQAARWGIRQQAARSVGARQQRALNQTAGDHAVREGAHDELGRLQDQKAGRQADAAQKDLAERDELRARRTSVDEQLTALEVSKARREQLAAGAHAPDTSVLSEHDQKQRNSLLAERSSLDQTLARNQERYEHAESTLARGGKLDAPARDAALQKLRDGADPRPTSDQNLRAYAGISRTEFDRLTPQQRAEKAGEISAIIEREQTLLALHDNTLKGGTGGPAAKAAAAQALDPDDVARRRSAKRRELSESVGEREVARGQLALRDRHRRRARAGEQRRQEHEDIVEQRSRETFLRTRRSGVWRR